MGSREKANALRPTGSRATSAPARAGARPPEASPWADPAIVDQYLDGFRQALPCAAEHLRIPGRLAMAGNRRPRIIRDLGAGDGVLVRYFADLYPDARLVALDCHAPMVEKLRRLANTGLAGRLEVADADLSSPEWMQAIGASAARPGRVSRLT